MTWTLEKAPLTPTARSSPQRERQYPERRGACPRLSAPMQTGDGLLVRLIPVATIPLPVFAKLCAAAQEHGNGTVEITARGSIQVRGLSIASAPRFAATIAALGIAVSDGVPVLSNALTGIDPEEILDAGVLAAALRDALARTALAQGLAPKISVAIDGGGAIGLDGIAADVRLRAELAGGKVALRLGVGGADDSAAWLGAVAPEDAVEAVLRLLCVIARHGRNARARDVLASEGSAAFKSAVGALLSISARPSERTVNGDRAPIRDAIGLHRLRAGALACGIALGFGYADAETLRRLVEAAAKAGVSAVRPAPDRALLTIGLVPETAAAFADAAERLGFIVRADDPRRAIIACAGAPSCASAHIRTRALASHVAETAAPFRDGSFAIHLSGCAKGCAQPAAAALTIVGTRDGCALVANGSSRDAPFAVVASDELPAAIERYVRDPCREAGHV